LIERAAAIAAWDPAAKTFTTMPGRNGEYTRNREVEELLFMTLAR